MRTGEHGVFKTEEQKNMFFLKTGEQKNMGF